MSKENVQVLFVKRPYGIFDAKETFTFVKTPLPTQSELKDGQFLVKNYYLSLDPAMRGWMNMTRSYIKPVEINEVMRGSTVGEVVLSKNPKFKVGDKIQGTLGWQEYALTDGKDIQKINPPSGVSLRDFLGVLGITGLTAYFGLLEVGKPKPGDTVVVSGAAGATGSIVGQIAKIKGARVIGIAGSEEKCNWLTNDLGFDMAINYRDPNFAKKLSNATPRFIDVYFDNVGGDILDHCLKRIAKNGRIVLCGAISQYNEKQPKGPAFYTALITQRAKMEGFIILDYVQRFPDAIKDISKWLKEGKIKSKDYIIEGLENAPDGLLKLFDGHNTGKMLVKISDENMKSKL